MISPSVSLANIRGKKFFKKMLGVKVYDIEGNYVGYVKRVVLHRKTGRAKEITVGTSSGRSLSLKPEELTVIDKRLIYLKGVRARTPIPISWSVDVSDISRLMVEIEEGVKRLSSLRDELLILDELLIRGSIRRDEYDELRSKIERERAATIRKIREGMSRIDGDRLEALAAFGNRQVYWKLLKLQEILEELEVHVEDSVDIDSFIRIIAS